jgi:hypothetical protein
LLSWRTVEINHFKMQMNLPLAALAKYFDQSHHFV